MGYFARSFDRDENANICEEEIEERNDAGAEKSCPVGIVVDIGRIQAEWGESKV